MSYQVLARKWRPGTFDAMVGQAHIVRALVNALDHQRLHHAYLFTGTRGVGKTTLARIFAKCLNCEEGITSKPCDQCLSCQEINSGRFIDLIEVDAASRTKVEDTRDLLDNIPYAPTRGRFKVYLIDEVHMLSNHSFNALLKTLEEPPSHVKFLLATTDPQKLPITILSRCLQFHLKCLSIEQIAAQLAHILEQEQIIFEAEALSYLAEGATGSMRDALSLLDQAIAYGNGKVETELVKAMLSTIDNSYLYQIMEALAERQAAKIIDVTQQLAEQASDFANVLEELLSLLHQIAIAQFVPDIKFESRDKEKIQHFANTFTPKDIQLYYQIGLIGRRDLPLAPTPKSGLEMVLLRMMAFHPLEETASLIEQSSDNSFSSAPPPSSDWPELVKKLNLGGISGAIASQCILNKMTENSIELLLNPAHATLLNKKQQEHLTAALSDYFKRPVSLTILIGKPDMLTPALLDNQEQIKKLQIAEKAIQKDENISNIMTTFDAKILPNSIEKIDE